MAAETIRDSYCSPNRRDSITRSGAVGGWGIRCLDSLAPALLHLVFVDGSRKKGTAVGSAILQALITSEESSPNP